MVTTRFAAALIAAGLSMVLAAAAAVAVTLNEGDILVSDVFFGHVLRINPVTGDQTKVPSDTFFWRPTGVAMEANGAIVVADELRVEVGRIDPAADARTTLSSGAMFTKVTAIAVEANGNILVTDLPLGVVRVDPVSGIQTTVSIYWDILTEIGGLAVEADGQILIVDALAGVIRTDPRTGARTTVSSGGSFVSPAGLAVAANGDILVADASVGVIRVDPVTGAQTIVSSGGLLQSIHSVAVEANGDIVVADAAAAAVIRIDPASGDQSIVSSFGLLRVPWAITVVPRLIPRFACAGFDDIADTALKVTKPRTIPLRAELLDQGLPIAGGGLAAAPVIQVDFASGAPAEPATDVTDLVPPPDRAFVGNQFLYKEASARWFHGLQTIKMSPPGTYTITIVSGDDREYVIDPPCTASYVIE